MEGSDFTAKIIACVPAAMSATPEEVLVARNKIAPTQPILEAVKPTTIELSTQPNPFWDKTTIQLSLKEAQNVHIGIFSLLGSEVKILASDENLTAGTHEFTFDKANLSSGMYIVKVFNQEISLSKKIILVEGN